jgi:hypothetical protein
MCPAGLARYTEGGEAAQIVPIDRADFATLCALDRRISPAPCEACLRCWIAMPGSTALAWVEGGGIRG